jgi:hypothetical protein
MEQLFLLDASLAPTSSSRPARPRVAVTAATMKKIEQLGLNEAVIDPDAYRRRVARKERKCLSCLTVFRSSGPGNRICSDCKEGVDWSSPVASFSVAATF